MYLPPHRPGDAQGANLTKIKNLLQSTGDIPEALVSPLREVAQSLSPEPGGKGLAMFSVPENFYAYRMETAVEPKLVFGPRPFLIPALAEAAIQRELYILGISRKHVRLWRYRNTECEEVPLPTKVPTSVTEANEFDAPDHNLANRSSAGSSAGAMGGVRFTTLTDRESAPEYLHHFFTEIDRGLHPFLRDAPLMLAGVSEEIAAYRKVAHYSHMLEEQLERSPELLTPAELARLAHAAAHSEYERQAILVLEKFREMTERHKTERGRVAVADAAARGRVHQAVIARASDDEALNSIAVDTIRHGGQVFTLPAERMGEEAPVVAVLRY